MVKEGVGWSRRGGKKFRVKDVEIDRVKEEMRRIQREMKCGEERKEELKEERRKNRAELQRRVRIGRNKIKMERMRKIEEEKDKGGLIKKLEAWSGKKMGVTGGDRERMRDESGKWVQGEEMRRKWRETFERVGIELRERKGFDEGVKEVVEKEMKEWVGWEGVGWGGVDECISGEGGVEVALDMEVREEEVERAVRELKGNAAG